MIAFLSTLLFLPLQARALNTSPTGLSHSVNHIQLKETCSSSRTSYGAIQYHGDENALEVNASDLSPGQVTAISKYRVSRATEGLSHSSTIDQRLNSSPNVMRFKNHQETVDWRARSDPFSTVPQTDPFMVESKPRSHLYL